jgi:hypothetical protein
LYKTFNTPRYKMYLITNGDIDTKFGILGIDVRILHPKQFNLCNPCNSLISVSQIIHIVLLIIIYSIKNKN